MSEIKVNLSIVLPGRTMWSKEECLKTTQREIKSKGKKRFETVTEVKDWSKLERQHCKVRLKDNRTESITYYVRKCKPAAQSLNISKDAYLYYVSKDSMLVGYKPAKWATMTKKERLEAHLKNICEGLGGKSFTYHVFED